ncbi:phosphatase PAP2 family protein [Chthonobacter albigriseus]|uniref:phosphatase PAP2 family protein n=1 Tax=Chthonobacter albigriseus TaxID=1683161 RepID=UPI0015EFC6C2|nr:phosphatase PAP2 family protein [Chthonobacter albigriseus]
MLWDIDKALVAFINSYAQKSWAFDRAISFLINADTVKALPFVVVLTGYWFARGNQTEHRRTVLSTLIGAFVAMVITRAWQNLGPARPRPQQDPLLDFVMPSGATRAERLDWSSFPSDTAGLTMALAFGIFLLNRRLGVVMLIWGFVLSCLPRIYFGLHYPSDIAAGTLIGILAVYSADRSSLPDWLARPVGLAEARWPGLFYAVALFVAFQLSTYFFDIRTAGKRIANAFEHHRSAEVETIAVPAVPSPDTEDPG